MSISSISCFSYSIRDKECSFRNHAVLFLSDLQAKIALISARAFNFLAACWQAVQQIYFKLIKRSQETDAHAVELQSIRPENTTHEFRYRCSLEAFHFLPEERRKILESRYSDCKRNHSSYMEIVIEVQAPPDSKIGVLRQLLAKEIGAPLESVRLKTHCPLEDDKDPDYYGIRRGETYKINIIVNRN